jgi:hypothetical protein
MIAISRNERNSERSLGQCHCFRHGHDLNSREDSILGSVLKMPKPNCAYITVGTWDKMTEGGVVSWGTALQAGRWRMRFPIVVIGIFQWTKLPAALRPSGRLSLQQKKVPGIFSGRYRRRLLRADNLTTYMPRLSWNLRPSGQEVEACSRFALLFTQVKGVILIFV